VGGSRLTGRHVWLAELSGKQVEWIALGLGLLLVAVVVGTTWSTRRRVRALEKLITRLIVRRAARGIEQDPDNGPHDSHRDA